MRVTRRPAASGLSPRRLLGLLVVVVGLLAMHGFASHGAEGMDVVPGAAMTHAHSVTTSLMSGDAAAVSIDHEVIAAVDQARPSGSGDAGHGDMGMTIAMMCLAILGVALLALASRLRGEGCCSLFAALGHPAKPISYAGRGPAPPSLIGLSIQRC